MAQSKASIAAKPDLKLAKGFAIEETLRSYFANQDFFALRSIPFRLAGTDITDIDLWLYERPASVSRRRTIVDVKNKKSPQAAERLIWTKGLQSALSIDGAMIATTDTSAAIQRLARTLNVDVIHLGAFQQAVASSNLPDIFVPQSHLETAIKNLDRQRRQNSWSEALVDLKSSLISNFGFGSANLALQALNFYGSELLVAPGDSVRAAIAVRSVYLSAACAAVSLDFAMAPYLLRSADQRKVVATNGIRFGTGEASAALTKVRAASSLMEKYLENGSFLAKTVESSFKAEADEIPAEIIAEYVTNGDLSEILFEPACALLDESLSLKLTTYDGLDFRSKALISVFLDFVGISRERFANQTDAAKDCGFIVSGEPEQLSLT
jgi:hypothetical protein